MTRRFAELVLSAERRPAVICGGGPSLPQQLEIASRYLEKPVFFSVNEHGARLRACDYVVCFDSIEQRVRRYAGRAPIVSPQWFADIRVANHPYLPDSSALAAWCAWMMGCAPIVLCGIDLYGGQGGVYWHSREAESRGAGVSVAEHLNRWRRVALVVAGQVRSMGGPLLEAGIFPAFDPLELPSGIPLIEYALQQAVGVTLEMRQPFDVRGRHLEPGERVELPFELAEHFLVDGIAGPPS